MTELKTLNDIDFRETRDFGRTELKAEAVKWIRELRDYEDTKLLRDFFNLTEEDLK